MRWLSRLAVYGGLVIALACAPSPTATPTPTPGQGTIEVRVTDAPPEGVSKVRVTVDDIKVHRAGATEEAGWETVIEGATSFDLVAVTGPEEILGSNTVTAGETMCPVLTSTDTFHTFVDELGGG